MESRSRLPENPKSCTPQANAEQVTAISEGSKVHVVVSQIIQLSCTPRATDLLERTGQDVEHLGHDDKEETQREVQSHQQTIQAPTKLYL